MDIPTLGSRGELLIERLERLIQQRTSGGIEQLQIDVVADEVVLSGRTHTYYTKQLATHAALEALDQFILTNNIEVR